MTQEHVWMLIERADMRRKEDLERSMSEDESAATCDECGESPANLYGDTCYCETHKPRINK